MDLHKEMSDIVSKYIAERVAAGADTNETMAHIITEGLLLSASFAVGTPMPVEGFAVTAATFFQLQQDAMVERFGNPEALAKMGIEPSQVAEASPVKN